MSVRFEFVPESERIAYYAACDIAWGLGSLLDDMGEAALMGKRAEKLVEQHFTWDKVVANGRKY